VETIVEPDCELVDLVERARAGEQTAFRDLYDSFAASAYRVAAGVLGRGPAAEDAVQDAFVAVFGHLDQIREPSAFKGFLLRSVRNKAIDIVRRDRLIPMDPWDLPEDASPVAVAEAPDIDEHLADEEALEVARTALTALGERDAMALTLAEAGGLDGNDLADALGVDNRSHAYVIVNRAKGRFRVAAGALLLVRHGRNCSDLKKLLADTGPFSPAVVRKVNAHVKDCDTCRHRRTLLLDSPEMAYALEGPAPDAAVLERMWETVATAVTGSAGSFLRRAALVGGIVIVAFLALLGAAAWGGGSEVQPEPVAATAPLESTTTAPATTTGPPLITLPVEAPPSEGEPRDSPTTTRSRSSSSDSSSGSDGGGASTATSRPPRTRHSTTTTTKPSTPPSTIKPGSGPPIR